MKRTNKYLTAAAAALTTSLLLAGCTQTSSKDNQPETGSMILSVNPEIRITYDEHGNVTNLDGMNTDGESIVTSYQDYVGKDCRTVLDDLIAKIHEAGYFIEDLDGNPRNIILQFEQGTIMPEQEFQFIHSNTMIEIKFTVIKYSTSCINICLCKCNLLCFIQ